MTTIERLDYSKAPPGYAVTESCGWWPADDAGELVREDESFDTEADALTAAWAHYKAKHDPPGCCIGLVMKGQGATERGSYCVDFGASEAFAVPAWKGGKVDAGARLVARAAAWAWHDRRHALAIMWPRCLAWTDAQVAEVERVSAHGGFRLASGLVWVSPEQGAIAA